MRVLVAGGTGFIGRNVVLALRARGDEVLVVTRNPQGAGEIAYDNLPEHADAIINLAGEWVAGIWTKEKKRRILESRVEITRSIVDWMLDRPDHLPVLINASAVGFYGHRPGEILTEESSYDPQNAFRGRVCQAWEAEAQRAADMGARVVLCRIGGVLDVEGGLLKLFLPLMRYSPVLVPPSANKAFSWISLQDTVRLMLFALDGKVYGPLNVVAPHPVTYGEFVRLLGQKMGKRALGSVPAWLIRLLLGENSEAITDSQDVRPAKALAHGFVFEHPSLQDWIASESASKLSSLGCFRALERSYP